MPSKLGRSGRATRHQTPTGSKQRLAVCQVAHSCTSFQQVPQWNEVCLTDSGWLTSLFDELCVWRPCRR